MRSIKKQTPATTPDPNGRHQQTPAARDQRSQRIREAADDAARFVRRTR